MSIVRGRRAARVLPLLWALFIVYGSFIPFDLTTDPEVIRRHIEFAKLPPFVDGKRNFRIPDAVSNVLLYVPLGMLLVARGRGALAAGQSGRIVLAGVAGAVLSTAVEVGQLFTVSRITSLTDVICNTTGTVLGAGMAGMVATMMQGPAGARLAGLVRRLPVVLLIALVAVALMMDRFYPFAVTLDVSTVWSSVRRAQWRPFGSFQQRFWADPVMTVGVPCALLAALLKVAFERLGAVPPAIGAWFTTVAFAVALEAGKIFFDRVPNIDNVILALLGGLAGVTIVPAIAVWQRGRACPGVMLLGLAVALLTYAELTPFDFALAPAAIAAKAQRIEWVPFGSYYGADWQVALFDLWTKVLLGGFLGFAWSTVTGRGAWASACVGGVAGLVLEAGQVLEVSRGPSIADVLDLGIAGYVGGVVHARYWRWRYSEEPDRDAPGIARIL